jgi:HD-like signal output (HDOD) protein
MGDVFESAFKELPPLPDVAMKLIGAINDPRSGSKAIVGILKTDAALTAEVLRRANSPVYGLSSSVASAGQAVMMLGTDEIRRLAMSISLGQHFGSGQRAMRRLWRHAFARAMVAERLASVTGVATEVAYTAGLLADIGIYGLMVSFPEAEQRILEHASNVEAVVAAEVREHGVNHCQAGEWLARRWRLPEAIVAGVARHHDVPLGPTLAAHVYWADRVAAFLAFGFLGTVQPTADVAGYDDFRREVPVAGVALPKDAEELFAWLVARVPA